MAEFYHRDSCYITIFKARFGNSVIFRNFRVWFFGPSADYFHIFYHHYRYIHTFISGDHVSFSTFGRNDGKIRNDDGSHRKYEHF